MKSSEIHGEIHGNPPIFRTPPYESTINHMPGTTWQVVRWSPTATLDSVSTVIRYCMWRFRESYTPSHHPFVDGLFHEKNQPAIGAPHLWKAPCMFPLVCCVLQWDDCLPFCRHYLGWNTWWAAHIALLNPRSSQLVKPPNIVYPSQTVLNLDLNQLS